MFRSESEPGRDFVKRIIGLPGERVQILAGVPHINGVPLAQEHVGAGGEGGLARIVRETLPNGVAYETLDSGATDLDNTRVYLVPEGAYFVIGDNRDQSADSRVPWFGFVPFDNLIGRVDYHIAAADTPRD